MPRKRWIGIGVAVAVLALVGVVLVVVRGGDRGPGKEAKAYLQAWEGFDGAAMARLADPPEPVGPAVTAMQKDLRVTKARFTPGAIEADGDTAVVPFTAVLEVGGLGDWTYTGRLDMARVNGDWRVQWSEWSLHPDLRPGRALVLDRTWPDRAPILGPDGAPLVAEGDVFVIGLDTGKIKDQAAVEAVLQSLLGVAPADVRAALAQSWVRPGLLVPIREVRPDRYAVLRPQLAPVPGVVFDRGRSRLALRDDFAAHVVGRVGEVTAERLAELGPPYAVGNEVGLSGIELAHERRLAGTPAGEVQLWEGGRPVQVLHRFSGTPPQPVRLTLDPAVQQAAERALDGVTQPAALVAVDAATGDVKGSVSRPLTEEFNRGLDGRYPPGSTFKIVTTGALLAGA